LQGSIAANQVASSEGIFGKLESLFRDPEGNFQRSRIYLAKNAGFVQSYYVSNT